MTVRQKIIERRNRFTGFFNRCITFHFELERGGKGHKGHGLDHDLLVAQYAVLIAEDERTADKAWVAALVHSYDRFFDGTLSDTATEIDKALSYLPKGAFTADEIEEIRQAVLAHDRSNLPDDSPTKITLQDADRLSSAGPIVYIRSGQFNPTIPAIELGYTGLDRAPGSTYKAPRSCKDDLIGCLEWETDPKFGLRLPKAKEMGKKYFDFMRQFFSLLEGQFVETGLDIWPLPA